MDDDATSRRIVCPFERHECVSRQFYSLAWNNSFDVVRNGLWHPLWFRVSTAFAMLLRMTIYVMAKLHLLATVIIYRTRFFDLSKQLGVANDEEVKQSPSYFNSRVAT